MCDTLLHLYLLALTLYFSSVFYFSIYTVEGHQDSEVCMYAPEHGTTIHTLYSTNMEVLYVTYTLQYSALYHNYAVCYSTGEAPAIET